MYKARPCSSCSLSFPFFFFVPAFLALLSDLLGFSSHLLLPSVFFTLSPHPTQPSISVQTFEIMFLVDLDIFLFSLIFLDFLNFSVMFNVFRTDCFYIFGF